MGPKTQKQCSDMIVYTREENRRKIQCISWKTSTGTSEVLMWKAERERKKEIHEDTQEHKEETQV